VRGDLLHVLSGDYLYHLPGRGTLEHETMGGAPVSGGLVIIVSGVVNRPILVFQCMSEFVSQNDVIHFGRNFFQLFLGRLFAGVGGPARKRWNAHFLCLAVIQTRDLAHKKVRIDGFEVGPGRDDVQPGEKFLVTVKLGAREFFVQFTVRDGSKLLFRDVIDWHVLDKFFPAKGFHLPSNVPEITVAGDLVRGRLGSADRG
jgi:hypothetical protein